MVRYDGITAFLFGGRIDLKQQIITRIEVQKNNQERVNVYLDGEFAFGLTLMLAVPLRTGQPLSVEEVTALKHHDEIELAVERAIRFLSYRPRSLSEVRNNLKSKGHSEAIIEVAIGKLEGLGYVNDIAFAQYWIENRDTFKPRSPQVLMVELRQKGVSADIIEMVLDGMDAEDSAKRAVHQRLSRYRGHRLEDARAQLSAYLARRGFRHEVIREALQQVLEELQETEPDYFSLDDE
ncbi:MAG: regulatory protein RecX [Phototrophicaceae bacterium]